MHIIILLQSFLTYHYNYIVQSLLTWTLQLLSGSICCAVAWKTLSTQTWPPHFFAGEGVRSVLQTAYSVYRWISLLRRLLPRAFMQQNITSDSMASWRTQDCIPCLTCPLGLRLSLIFVRVLKTRLHLLLSCHCFFFCAHLRTRTMSASAPHCTWHG